MKKQSYILKQLFDVRPMTIDGALHWNRILRVKKHLNLRAASANITPKAKSARSASEVFAPILTNYYQPKIKEANFISTSSTGEQSSPGGQRERIMSDLERFLAGGHISPSHIMPIRQIDVGEKTISASQFLPPPEQSSRQPAKRRVGGFLAGILILFAGGAFLFFSYQGVSVSQKQLPAAGGLAVIEKSAKHAASQENPAIPKYASDILNLLDGSRDQNILVLFQNPAKIRATGGFIEKYGVITINNGKITKIITDDIFNLDGQLREKIIPPLPLQKISTAWSAHDSNWFFDFPTSAKKAAQFYEMASGERVSVVVALNPSALEKLLAISGTFEGMFDDGKNLPKIVSALEESAKTKDVMFYFLDAKAQDLIASQGFDGAVLKSQDDYLAVVLSNISGDAADGKKISAGAINLKSEIADNGQATNTLTIEYPFDAGADFARIYVPGGAQLIDIKGQAIKTVKAPIDYQKLGFEKDRDVSQIESSFIADKKTGTYIYEESGKTVFANWVDVNSKNPVKITYKYILPAKYNFDGGYQMIFQKQSGIQMKLNWQIDFSDDRKIIQSDFNQDLVINL